MLLEKEVNDDTVFAAVRDSFLTWDDDDKGIHYPGSYHLNIHVTYVFR